MIERFILFFLQGYNAMNEYIKLDDFLKLNSIVSSGGEAKHLIREGNVYINGEIELRRGRKLHKGDVVEIDNESWIVP